MQTLLTVSLLIWAMMSCQTSISKKEVQQIDATMTNDEQVIVGAEQVNTVLSKLNGKRVGCVVNQTSKSNDIHFVDLLMVNQVDVVKVFAPEHGFRGEADAGARIDDMVDAKTKLPIVSLYGKKKKPAKEDLEGIDIVVFDIQDVGARFYTYISTLHYVMEACAEAGIKVLILDRPNPNAHYIDGPVLDPQFASFVGMHPVPVVYGMTIGEYGRMINGEGWLDNHIRCDLEVIPIKNYTHQVAYELPVKPSPNLPNYTSILLYPSLCFFEGTSVSVGRGTDHQFQVIGHPSLDSYNYSFVPEPKVGAKAPPQNGVKCYGLALYDLSVKEIFHEKKLNLNYVIEFNEALKAAGIQMIDRPDFFDKLAGTDQLRLMIEAGQPEEKIRATWQDDIDAFMYVREKYLLYE